MTLPLFGCHKFQVLSSEASDRALLEREAAFLTAHRQRCVKCRRAEASSCMALNMLRASALEPDVTSGFDDRLIRRIRVQQVRESLTYWSPAMAGAAIACITIFAALALIARAPQGKHSIPQAGEARRFEPADRVLPNLVLNKIPRIDR
jgi:hypothetical protein